MIHHHVTPLLSELSFVTDFVSQELHLGPALCHGTIPLCPRQLEHLLSHAHVVRIWYVPQILDLQKIALRNLRTFPNLFRNYELKWCS